MDEPVNPYASPQAELTAAPFAQEGQLAIPGLRTTGIGLSMIYYGIVIILLAFLVIFFSGVALAFGQQPSGGSRAFSTYRVIVIGCGAAILLGSTMNIIGHIVCLFVPSQSRAKAYIISAVLLQILSIALSVFLTVPGLTPNPTLSNYILIFINLFGLADAIFFVLFMRKLSEYIGRSDLMNKAKNIFILVFLLFFIAVVMFSGTFILKNDYFRFLVVILMIGGLIAFVMYANLINALRKVLLGKEPCAKKSNLLCHGMEANTP
jgi:hypothetical protein